MERMAAQMKGSDTSMAASKRFGRYKKENPKESRAAEVRDDVARMRSLWRRFAAFMGEKSRFQEPWNTKTDDAMDIIRGEEISPADITRFVLALEKSDVDMDGSSMDSLDQKGYLGVFISAMINGSSETEFLIPTSHLDFRIDCLGWRNRKNITIEGDAGQYLGCHMEGGSISVGGRAGSNFGEDMSGGEIDIWGEGIHTSKWVSASPDESILGDVRGGTIRHRGETIFPVPRTLRGLRYDIMLISNNDEALIYNERLEQIGRVPMEDVEDALKRIPGPFALIIASDITQGMVELAQGSGIRILVGYEVKGVEDAPQGMELMATVPDILVYRKK